MGGGSRRGQRGDLLLRARRPQAVQQPGHGARVVEGDVGGGAVGQRGDLLLRAPLPQAVQQAGHGARVVEGDVGGGALGQRGDLLLRARLPQAVQQPGHGVRVVEGDVGGGALGQRGDLLLRARLPQAVQQPGHGARVVEGDVGGGITGSSAVTCSCAPASRRLSSSAATAPGSSRETWAAGSRCQQRGDLLLRARLPQAVQQPGHGARVVEGDVGGGPAHGAGVSAEVVRRVAEVENSAEVAAGGGVLVELGGVTVQAASVGGITERGLVAGEGVIGRCGPEACRGELALPVRPGRADRGSPRAGTAARPRCWPGRRPAAHRCPGSRVLGARDLAGRGRMRVSGPRTPLHGTAV